MLPDMQKLKRIKEVKVGKLTLVIEITASAFGGKQLIGANARIYVKLVKDQDGRVIYNAN